MIHIKKSIFFLAAVLLVVGMVARPAQAQASIEASTTVVYNIFATDTYLTMVDNTPDAPNRVYMYGFVGGRAGKPLSYLDVNGNLQTLHSGAPSPQGGPVTTSEQPLAGSAQYPGPAIWATTNQVVEIHFKNLGVWDDPIAPNDPHSIHLHGLDVNQANDGVPETSVGAIPANLCADGSNALGPLFDCAGHGGFYAGAGNVLVYMFTQRKPGTYFYHCHQEADIHVQMGMYGAMVIYNPGDAAASTGPGTGKGGTLFGWKYDKDYIMLESEIDVRQHASEEGTYVPQPGDPGFDLNNPGAISIDYNPIAYTPQYWQLNGISFPNTIHVDTPGFVWADWIKAHPNYDPFIQGSSSKPHPGTLLPRGDKILLRFINMGFETQPMHMHGFHGKVIGSDQRAWSWANNAASTPWGMGLEKNTLTIGSGEAYEWLIDLGQQESSSNYSAGTQTKYDQDGLPVDNTGSGETIVGPEAPYLPGPTITGTILGDPSSPAGQYFPFHNHDDYKATNNGVYPGGMFTMIKVMP
jgi:manganese oxidase